MPLDDLERLGRILTERLEAEFLEIVPFEARCVFKEDTLSILAEHAEYSEPDRQKAFNLLHEALQEQQPEYSIPVVVYLRVEGKREPYTYHSFTLEPFVTATSDEPVVEEASADEVDEDNPFDWAEITETESIWVEGLENSEAKFLEDSSSLDETDSEALPEILPAPSSWEPPNSEESYPNEQPHRTPNPQSVEGWRPVLPVILAGTGISLAVFFASFYALTRPCVINTCQEMPLAQQFSNKSVQTLEMAQSGQEILQSKRQLHQAIIILKRIPIWSSEYNQAQELLKVYQAQEQHVDRLIEGMNQAATASAKSQNPPHSLSEWQEIQKLWQNAIATIVQIPNNSKIYQLAQQKRQAYQVKLALINQRLTTEQKANKGLQEAKEDAEIASARQGIAQSLSDWQEAQTTWQSSINWLSQISPETTVYREAQQLLKSNKSQLEATRTHELQEEFAANAYQQSLQMAQLAKNSQNSNQWAQAISNWHNAVTSLKQIPNSSLYYSKAQLLIGSYTDAFKQAQGKLQLAVLMQQAHKDLNKTCSGVPQVCTYTVTSSLIKVQMTPAYARTVKQTALTAKEMRDYKTQLGVFNHVLTVGKALEAISDNAHLRLEVYSPDGTLIQTHNRS